MVNENRAVQSFTGIILKIPANLYYTEEANRKLELRAQQNILDESETDVNGNNLEIKVRRHHNTNDSGYVMVINIYVSAPEINYLETRGSGNLYAACRYPSFVKLSVDGSGNVQINQ